jgi:hypothetical protein
MFPAGVQYLFIIQSKSQSGLRFKFQNAPKSGSLRNSPRLLDVSDPGKMVLVDFNSKA